MPAYCPRCGTERIEGMGFCARCGLNLGEPDGTPASVATPASAPPPPPPEHVATRNLALRPSTLVPMPLLALIAVVGVGLLLYFGFQGRGQPPALPGPGSTSVPSAASAAPASAPPVGLTILSPTNGAVVGSKTLTVIGSAPAGLRIVQDISFGFDRSTTVDGTGHWAMQLELAEGPNAMTFRIGDDKSTAQTITVTYAPQPAP